jgi:uncharacterized protein YdaU (DUF1376 family)
VDPTVADGAAPMSTRAPWFRCYQAELLNEVAGMEPNAGYVYLVILFRIFDADGPVADDEHTLARRINLPVKKVAAAIEWLIRHKKVTRLEDGKCDSPTTHDELAHREKMIKDAQNAGKESARKRLINQQNGATLVERPFNDKIREEERREESESESKKESTNESRAQERVAFDRFWAVYPNKVGKPAAERAFHKVWREADAIIVGIKRYVAAKPADRPWLNPTTFLHQERWKDVPASSGALPPHQRKFAHAYQIRTYD